MLFRLEFSAPRSTIEVDRRMGKTRDKSLMRDQTCRASLMRWVSNYIAEQVPDPKWISHQQSP